MSEEIELSIMANTADNIQPLLDRFEAQEKIKVRVRLLAWDTAWSDLVKFALYSDGPDVSEIGSTWLGDLVAMNALRPFADYEVASLGGAGAFLAATWQGTRVLGDDATWAIPWFTGARLLFYRKSLFAQAGVDDCNAFDTAEQLDRALGQLEAGGVEIPWTVPTGVTHTTLLNVCSWVWGAGGDFVTADGKRTLFSHTRARAGLRAYFALGRFMGPGVRHLTGLQPDEVFLQNPQVGATLSGSWMFRDAQQRGTPDLKQELGVALPPGASFVGGSHLVTWKYTPKTEAVHRLIRFLTQPEPQAYYSQQVGLLPTRLDALNQEPYASDTLWQTTIQGNRTGRSFPVTRSWGLMEDRLTTELSGLWKNALAQPDADLDSLIVRRLEPLAKRLDLVLGQN